MSEAARGRGMGVTGASPRARGTDEARGDSLGAPRPSIVPDLAPPHGALVGGHDRTRALVPCGYAARCEWPAPSLPKYEGCAGKIGNATQLFARPMCR